MIIAVLFLLLILILLLLPLRVHLWADGSEEIFLRLFYCKIPLKRIRFILKLRSGIPYVYMEGKKACARIFPKVNRKNQRRVPLLHAVLWVYWIEKLRIHIVIGMEDAAQTAYAAGVLRGVLGAMLPRLRLKEFEAASIEVNPCFDEVCFSVNAECIISAIPANIIRKAISRKKDNQKGGKKNAPHRKHSDKHDE